MTLDLPETYKQLVITRFSPTFSAAAQVRSLPTSELTSQLVSKADHVLVKIVYSSPRASDRNDSNGNYGKFGGFPFPAGYEGLGSILAVGSSVTEFAPGDAVGLLLFTRGGASEYLVTHEWSVYHIPSPSPEFLTFFNAGLTALQGLFLPTGGNLPVLGGSPMAKYIPENLSSTGKQLTVLITAAAGGVGVMACQYAKLAGHKVIGVAGGKEKGVFVQSQLGATPVDYKGLPSPSHLTDAILAIAPGGVDVFWDTVGGESAVAMAKAGAEGVRVVIIGKISEGYGDEDAAKKKETDNGSGAHRISAASLTSGNPSSASAGSTSGAPQTPAEQVRSIVASKKGSIGSFLLSEGGKEGRERTVRMVGIEVGLWSEKLLKGYVDDRGGFRGLEKYGDAVEYLHAGKNMGKIVVKVADA